MARELNRSIGILLRALGGGFLFRILAPAYRRFFISIKMFIKSTVPKDFNGSLLDLGGGDGAVLDLLLRTRNPRSVHFVDPTPNAGSMIRDPKVLKHVGSYLHEVTEIQDLRFDLILLVDVLHHVEPHLRKALLADAIGRLSTHGSLLIKEVEIKGIRSKLTYLADVYISKDPIVYFLSERSLTELIHQINPELHIRRHSRYGKLDRPNYAISVSFKTLP